MKHKGHHDIYHPEKQRDSEDGPPCLAHSETQRKELVVDVPLVRMERALTVPDTREEDTEDIKHRNQYDRNGIYEKFLAHDGLGRTEVVEAAQLHSEESKDISHRQRPCVAHKYLRDSRLSKGVINIEHHQHAQHRSSQHEVHAHRQPVEHQCITYAANNTQTRSETVNAVNEVYRIDDQHDDDQSKGNTDKRRDMVDSEYAVQVSDEKSCTADQRSRDDLYDELASVAHSDDIIHNAGQIQQHTSGCTHHKFGYRSVGNLELRWQEARHHSDDCQEGEKDGRKKGYAAKARDVPLMYLPLILRVVQMYPGSRTHNGRNHHSYKSEAHQEHRNIPENTEIHNFLFFNTLP